MNLSLGDFKDEGLYFIFPDLKPRIVLTRNNIQKITHVNAKDAGSI